MSSKNWQRPEDAGPYPREWDRFEGLRPLADGRVPSFWIRDLTPDMADEAVAHMQTYYQQDEQMCAASLTPDDARSAAALEAMWRDTVLRSRVSIAAFTEGSDGQPLLAGLNLLGVVLAGDPPMMMDGSKTRAMCALMNEMMAEADVWTRYGVRCFLLGLGLSVAPAYRGQGVGLHLLRARERICAALRVPLTVTAFSGAQSQKQARRAGFEVLQARRYADFVCDGARPFASASWTHIEIQAKFYGPRDDPPPPPPQ